MARRPLGSILLLATLTVLWGSNWVAMKLAVRELDPWIFRTIGLLVGGAGLLALVRAGGHSLAIPRGERGPLVVAALFNITAWHLCSAYGLTRIQANRAAIIAYTMPLWTVVFGRLFLGERMDRARLAALALGLAGLAALIVPDPGALWAAPGGTLLMLAAALAWGIGTVLTKASRWTMPTAALTGWQVVLGGIPIALGAAIRAAGGEGGSYFAQVASASPAAILGTAYATLVGVIFCHWAWFRIVAILPAAAAAIGTLGIPIVGVFASALVLGERVGAPELVALALVVGGLALLFRGLASESLAGPRAVTSIRRA